MRGLFQVVLAIPLVLGACSSKEGSAGSVGDGDDGSTGTDDGTDDGTTSSDDGSGTGDGSGGDGTTTGMGQTEVTISGTVQDFTALVPTPIPDAGVSVHQMPGFETTSDQNGEYEIVGLPANTEAFIVLDPSTDFFGGIRPVMLGDTDDDMVGLSMISRQFLQDQQDLIASQNPAVFDDTQSILLVRLLQNTATGAVVDVMPAPPPDTYYAPDAAGSAVMGQNTIEFALLPVVIYYNVDPSTASSISISVTHPDRECTVVHSSFPLLGEHLTLVDVDCPA